MRRSRRRSGLDNTIRQIQARQAKIPSPRRPSSKDSSLRPSNGWKMGLLLVLVMSVGLVVFLPYQQGAGQLRLGDGSHRAVLVDSLSATDPDPGFISSVNQTLSSAGYSVDYYGPRQVTVDLFRNLPLMGYSILIFRTHTATGSMAPPGQDIVTHQPYITSQYTFDQLVNRVTQALVRPGDKFFAITPSFISDETSGVGGYHGALIIQMGCSTLQARPDLATAYFERGASAFVGWNGLVSSYYTDVSTELFLSSLMHGKTLQQAVGSASVPDPDWGGQLTYLMPSGVSQQMLIDQLATVVVWALILTPALLLARRQGFFDAGLIWFKKRARRVSSHKSPSEFSRLTGNMHDS